MIWALLLLSQIVVERGSCSAEWFDVAELERQLATELAETSTKTRVRIACDDVTATVDTSERIDLSQVPKSLRARSLALIVAESMRRAPGPKTADPPPPPVLEPKLSAGAPAIAVRSYLDLSIGPTIVEYFAHRTELYGARIAISRELGSSWLTAGADVGATLGRDRDARGSVTMAGAVFGVHTSYLWRLGVARVAFGPRLEGSWLQFTGSTSVPGIAAAGGDAFVFSLGGRLSLLLFERLAFEAVAGSTLRGVTATADQQPIAGAEGAYLQVTIGWSTRFYLD